ncbi:Cyanovirin-N [Hypoxylon sp. NC0597]|nr:Cyanovirin-N [Hypoxylon sp. NC0597]
MAFSLTTKHVELRGSWLVALVQKDDNTWTFSKLNLNDHIGNNDGNFDVTMDRWYNSAEHWTCHLRGPFLCAQLRTLVGSWAPETYVNLDLFIRNKDGNLEFQKLSDSLLFYTACLTLEHSTLRGLVVGRDGKFHTSELNLDENIGNINGKFEAGERHYSRSGRNFHLEHGLDTIKLTAELADYAGDHHAAEIELSDFVINRKGQLDFIRRDETVDKEHWSTAIADQIPLFGSSVAGLHHLGEHENEEQLYRKIAASTNSANITVGTVIGAFIGRAIKAPVLGMVLGAGLSTSPHVLIGDKVAKAIEDPATRSQILEATVGKYVFVTLRDMIAADQITTAAQWLDAALNPSVDDWMKGLVAWLERQDITLPEFSLHTMLKRVFARLQGETIEEWDKALEVLQETKKRVEILKLEPEPEPEPEPEVLVEAPAADEAVEVPQKAEEEPQVTDESKTTGEAQTTNEPEAADVSSNSRTTTTTTDEPGKDVAATGDAKDDAKADERAKVDEPKAGESKVGDEHNTTATSSTRASSLKQQDRNGSKSSVGGDKPNGRNGSRKGWQSVLGISMLRSWSKHRQPKAVAV